VKRRLLEVIGAIICLFENVCGCCRENGDCLSACYY
jgi:hypothetical protein